MASLLETALTFVATMLLLALAAQSLQDVTKFAFAIKAWTRLTAVRRLVQESATAASAGSPEQAVAERHGQDQCATRRAG